MNSETLPENWEVVKLGEATEIIMGQSPKGDTYNTNGEGEPLINGPAEFGSEYPTPMQWTSKPTKLCKDGDILFCVRGNTTGRMNIADQRYCIGRGIAAIRERTQKSDTLFIRNLLEYRRSSLYRIAIGGGSTFPNISTVHLKNYIVSLPPLPEQRAIAHVLQTIQEAKAARQRERSLERERKSALMDYLFSYGTKGEPRKQTEIGEIPESWEVVQIGEVGQVVTGNTPKTSVPEYYGGPYMFIAPGDISEAQYVTKTNKHVSAKGLKVLRPLPCDAVLVVCIGATIGKTAMTSVELSVTNQQINAIIPNAKAFPHYVYYAITYRSRSLPSLAGRAAIPIVKKSIFAKFPILLPPLSEQQAIAETLQAFDIKIAALEHEAELLDELFHAMLDELMTGERSAMPLIDTGLPN